MLCREINENCMKFAQFLESGGPVSLFSTYRNGSPKKVECQQ